MCPLANLNKIMSTTPVNSHMSISGTILLSQRNNSAVASRDWQWNIHFEYLASYYFLFFESIAMLLVTVVMQTFYNLRVLSLLVFDIGIQMMNALTLEVKDEGLCYKASPELLLNQSLPSPAWNHLCPVSKKCTESQM